MLKRVFVLVLAALLSLAFVACGDAEGPSATLSSEQLAKLNEAGLPDYDFGGYEFNILSVGRADNYDDFTADETSENLLEQAKHTRNLQVEALYNVKVKPQWRSTTANQQSPEAYQALVREATAGDTNYDLCVIPGYDVSELAYGGFLTNLNALPHFDGTKTWYDQKANETFTFGDSLFFTAGDYGINLMDQTYCIAFNAKLAEDNKLENLYELVDNNQWTLEKMSELSKKVANEATGVYGNLYWVDSVYGALNSANRRLVELDDETLNYNLVAPDGITYGVLSDFYELVMDSNVSYKYQHNGTGAKREEWVNMFSGNKALFLLTTVNKLAEFRDMETDYGVLPYFLYTEGQVGGYHNTVAPFNMNFMCVPRVVEDYKRTSAVMEAIGYFSEQEILDPYYEKTLKGKTARDEDSVRMLDLIFDTRAYDIGYCYQPAHINKHLIYMLNDGTNDWPTRYASLELQAQAKLDVISEYYRGVIEK
ncbi:MAG: hypothetical protein IJC81_01545 [Clostridia bacterium]|nr:hypothetical protein [Clostridia bacterium]